MSITFKQNFKLGKNNDQNTAPDKSLINPFINKYDDNSLKSYKPATVMYGDKYTTLSQINYNNNFQNIENVRRGSITENILNRPQYPFSNIQNIEEMLTFSNNTDEFNNKLKMIELYAEIFDTDYYTKNFSKANYGEFTNISDNIYPNFTFAFVKNVPTTFAAYLVIRGIYVPMKVIKINPNLSPDESKDKSDKTMSAIIQYPDYLLKAYEEYYDSVSFIYLESYGNGKICVTNNKLESGITVTNGFFNNAFDERDNKKLITTGNYNNLNIIGYNQFG